VQESVNQKLLVVTAMPTSYWMDLAIQNATKCGRKST